MVVAVYGVDGSGKSTVIDGLAQRLGPAFRGVDRWHLLERQRPGVVAAPVTDPHGRPPRSAVASAAKAVWYLALAWLIRAPAVARSVRRGHLVVLDRDVADVWLDPRRYRLGGPRWIAALVAAAAPRPTIALVLNADTDTIAARSREVDMKDLPALLERYRSFASDRHWVELIDSANPPATVVATASRAVLAARVPAVERAPAGHVG
jgi:thymidylate kinase